MSVHLLNMRSASLAFKTHAVCTGLMALVLTSATFAVQLPQGHPYQKALRDYFATLTEADFKVELKPVTYAESFFAEMDTVARYWMLFLSSQADIPSSQGIRVSPKHFTLAAIEAGDAVNISPSRGGFMDPKDVAWWTQCDYPGNPFFGSKPLARRAFVTAAVDMITRIRTANPFTLSSKSRSV